MTNLTGNHCGIKDCLEKRTPEAHVEVAWPEWETTLVVPVCQRHLDLLSRRDMGKGQFSVEVP